LFVENFQLLFYVINWMQFSATTTDSINLY